MAFEPSVVSAVLVSTTSSVLVSTLRAFLASVASCSAVGVSTISVQQSVFQPSFATTLLGFLLRHRFRILLLRGPPLTLAWPMFSTTLVVNVPLYLVIIRIRTMLGLFRLKAFTPL